MLALMSYTLLKFCSVYFVLTLYYSDFMNKIFQFISCSLKDYTRESSGERVGHEISLGNEMSHPGFTILCHDDNENGCYCCITPPTHTALLV